MRIDKLIKLCDLYLVTPNELLDYDEYTTSIKGSNNVNSFNNNSRNINF